MNENIPNYGNKFVNNINQNVNQYLQEKYKIKQAMDNLKHEVASELGYENIKIPNGSDMTSRSIGVYAGPVGGVIVKDLIAMGEKALLEKYGKSDK